MGVVTRQNEVALCLGGSKIRHCLEPILDAWIFSNVLSSIACAGAFMGLALLLYFLCS